MSLTELGFIGKCPANHGSFANPAKCYKFGMLGRTRRARVKCELRNCDWVFCELKCEPARDWSAIFRTTRSLTDVNAIAHSRNFRTGNKTCILAHITHVYVMCATITVVINV